MKSVDLYGLHLKPAVRPHYKMRIGNFGLYPSRKQMEGGKMHILLGVSEDINLIFGFQIL